MVNLAIFDYGAGNIFILKNYPKNNSFIVVGVEDEANSISGVDFFDDSKIQNLINAYLSHPPVIQYENIPFPHLDDDKVVGLVTIRPKGPQEITSLRKNIWKSCKVLVFLWYSPFHRIQQNRPGPSIACFLLR